MIHEAAMAGFEATFPAGTTLTTATTRNQSEISSEILDKVLTTTTASLSIVGTLVIMITFVLWPDIRTNSRKIIVCISIGDFFVACSNILGVWEREMDHWKSACEIQAAIGMVAVLSTFFWTVYLSVYFYLVISKKISVDSERRIMLWFHFTGWGIPLAITAIAKEKGATGYSGDLVSSGWCWISSDQPWWKMLLWMVIAGKGWEILAYITISVFYVLIKLSIRREVQ